MNFIIFHHFDSLLVIKSVSFGDFRVFGEPYHDLPDPGLGHCNIVFCVLQDFFTFYLKQAFLAKPSSTPFLYPSTFPISNCLFPCTGPENIDFTSVYDRF